MLWMRGWGSMDRGPGTWDLARDGTLRVRPGRGGVVLRADRGLVLVTQAGDRDDHVLEAGEEVRLPRGGLVVAQAFEASRLVVEGAPAGDAGRRRARGPALVGG